MADRYNIRNADGTKVGSIEHDVVAEVVGEAIFAGLGSFFSSRVIELVLPPHGGATKALALIERGGGHNTKSHKVTLLESGGTIEKIDLPAMDFGAASFAPQGQYLAILGTHQAIINPSATISLIDTRSAQVVGNVKIPRVVTGNAGAAALRFSPDAQYIYSVVGTQLCQCEIKTGRVTTLVQGKRFLAGLALSPDGTAAVTLELNAVRAVGFGRLPLPKLIDTASGRLLQEPPTTATWEGALHATKKNGFALDFAPQGKQVALGGLSNRITIWDIQTNQSSTLPQAGQSKVVGLAFSPTGAYLAASYEDGIVRLWDAHTWQMSAKLCQHGDERTPITPCALHWLDEWRVISADIGGDIKVTPIPGMPMPAAPPSAPHTQSADEILAAIKQLGSLREAGLVTEVEFNEKKAELLRRL